MRSCRSSRCNLHPSTQQPWGQKNQAWKGEGRAAALEMPVPLLGAVVRASDADAAAAGLSKPAAGAVGMLVPVAWIAVGARTGAADPAAVG